MTPNASLEGLAALPQADQDAITRTLTALYTGFTERDTDALAGVYSADADWVNAFGSVKHGSVEILTYLDGLFTDEHFNDGTLAAPPDITVRILTPEVALVSAHLKIKGQTLIDGSVIDERDNHSLRVLHRQPDGCWPVVSEMYNDANTDQTYINHS